MANSSNIYHRPIIYLAFLCLTSLASFQLAIAESKHLENPGDPNTPAIQLSQQEILKTFADVRDDAKVQDAAGTVAVNHWYVDGRFISRWNNGRNSGEVVGTWRVENDQCCFGTYD